MSHPRRLVALMSAFAAALVSLFALAPAAHAAESVKVEIRGMPSNVTAGQESARFQATFANTTNEALSGVRAVIAVRLDGAPADAIRVQRQEGGDLAGQSTGDGTVIFADPAPFDLPRNGGRSHTVRYTLSFGQSAPDGEASITVAAVIGGETVGSDHESTDVVHGRGQQTTAPNTNPGFVPTFEAGPTYSLAPLPVAERPARVQASVPKSLYVLGLLLIVMGAASLFLIFRPPGRVSARVGGAGPHRLSGPSWHPRGGPTGGPQAWPAVTRAMPDPTRRMPPAGPGPATGVGRAIRDPGPHTGSTRPVRDSGPHTGTTHTVREPGPGEPLPPWLRP